MSFSVGSVGNSNYNGGDDMMNLVSDIANFRLEDNSSTDSMTQTLLPEKDENRGGDVGKAFMNMLGQGGNVDTLA